MLNKAILMGRLTRDPEIRYTQSNTPVTSFTVAIDRSFKSRDGERETDFINCVAWRTTAEFVSKYFTKGKMIVVVGSIQTRKYNDKDGNSRNAVEVVADEVMFGESKRDGDSGGSYGGQGGGRYAPPAREGSQMGGYDAPSSQLPAGDFADIGDDDDELPF